MNGKQIWEAVWEKTFIPLIFASASREEELINKATEHPLLRYVSKGEGEDSVGTIVEAVSQFLPIGVEIKSIRKRLREDTEENSQEALTKTAPHVLDAGDPSKNLDALLDAARSRLAMLMRQRLEEEGREAFVWEQYIYPPVSEHLLTGDVLKSKDGKSDDPNSFRVVLTPSCDLANNKVEEVLTAKCIPIAEFWDRASLSKKDKELGKITRWLSEAQAGGCKALYQFSGLLPDLGISFRDLELLTLESRTSAADSSGLVFERIVSLDSPYREQLVWGFLQVAGRPGLPLCDLQGWTREILNRFGKSNA
jgi:CTP synthase